MSDRRAYLVASHVALVIGGARISTEEVVNLTPGDAKAINARIVAIAISRKLGLDIHSVFGPDGARNAEEYLLICDQRRSAEPEFRTMWDFMFASCWKITEPDRNATRREAERDSVRPAA